MSASWVRVERIQIAKTHSEATAVNAKTDTSEIHTTDASVRFPFFSEVFVLK